MDSLNLFWIWWSMNFTKASYWGEKWVIIIPFHYMYIFNTTTIGAENSKENLLWKLLLEDLVILGSHLLNTLGAHPLGWNKIQFRFCGPIIKAAQLEGLTDHAHLLEGEDRLVGLRRRGGGDRGSASWWTAGASLSKQGCISKKNG